MLLFTDFCNKLIDEVDNCQVDVMALLDRFDHLVFRDFLCTGFDHDDLG